MNLLVGKKLGMTQIFEASGKLTPVTIVQVGPCPIVQIKTADKDGYAAVQLGFDEIKEQRLSKAEVGHCKKANVATHRTLKEVRVEDASQYNVGDVLDAKVFEGAERVHVVGKSKGRGFAGTIKRHNFTRGPMSHGSKNKRRPGSVGMCATPARIFKGKRLPGQMGDQKTTIRNLKLVQIDAENNLLYIKGAVPGANNGIVFVRKAQA